MTQTLRLALTAVLIASTGLAAQQPAAQPPAPTQTQPPQTQPPQTQPPGPTQTPAPAQTVPGQTPAPATPPAVAAAPAPVGLPLSRTFSGACGLWLQPVRPERVADFELFLDYVRDALARTSNPRVKSQAAGWRFYKATEPGPNGVVLYVFDINPAVRNTEYALGPILSEVYADPAQLSEIWSLYQSSVPSGGAILNLAPVTQRPPTPIVAKPVNPADPAAPGAAAGVAAAGAAAAGVAGAGAAAAGVAGAGAPAAGVAGAGVPAAGVAGAGAATVPGPAVTAPGVTAPAATTPAAAQPTLMPC